MVPCAIQQDLVVIHLVYNSLHLLIPYFESKGEVGGGEGEWGGSSILVLVVLLILGGCELTDKP